MHVLAVFLNVEIKFVLAALQTPQSQETVLNRCGAGGFIIDVTFIYKPCPK